MQFLGYKRKEGRAGIRNHVLILPTCACGSESARIVASQVRGAVNIGFNTGCSDVKANTEMSQKVLTGFACNPNVYGVVIIGLGCETVPHDKLREKIQAMTSKPVVVTLCVSLVRNWRTVFPSDCTMSPSCLK